MNEIQANHNQDYVKQCIQKFISSLEQENEVNIIFACEGGSRGWNTHTPNSDYDIRGIYIMSEEKYLSVTKGIGVLSCFTKNLPGTDLLIDYIFMDLRKLLKRNVENQRIQQNMIFQSKEWYINKFSQEQLNFMKEDLPIPVTGIRGHLKDLQKYITDPQNISPKKALNCIVFGLQLIHVYCFKTYPYYNCQEEIQHLKQWIVKIRNQDNIDESTQDILNFFDSLFLEQMIDKFESFLQMKKDDNPALQLQDGQLVQKFVENLINYKPENFTQPLNSTQANQQFQKVLKNIKQQ